MRISKQGLLVYSYSKGLAQMHPAPFPQGALHKMPHKDSEDIT